MRFVKVKYEKVFPLAQYVNEKIGVEIELEYGDSEDDAFALAKAKAERWHKEGNPELHYLTINAGIVNEPPVVQKENYQSVLTVNDILSCTSIVVLNAYKSMIGDDKDLLSALEQRKKQIGHENKL